MLTMTMAAAVVVMVRKFHSKSQVIHMMMVAFVVVMTRKFESESQMVRVGSVQIRRILRRGGSNLFPYRGGSNQLGLLADHGHSNNNHLRN